MLTKSLALATVISLAGTIVWAGCSGDDGTAPAGVTDDAGNPNHNDAAGNNENDSGNGTTPDSGSNDSGGNGPDVPIA